MPSCTGTPNKPVITAISGSASSDAPHTASITFNKTYTAAEYNIKLFDALGDDATPVDSKLLTPAGNDADASWTFTGLTKGLYRFEVRCWRSSWCAWGDDGHNRRLSGQVCF